MPSTDHELQQLAREYSTPDTLANRSRYLGAPSYLDHARWVTGQQPGTLDALGRLEQYQRFGALGERSVVCPSHCHAQPVERMAALIPTQSRKASSAQVEQAFALAMSACKRADQAREALRSVTESLGNRATIVGNPIPKGAGTEWQSAVQRGRLFAYPTESGALKVPAGGDRGTRLWLLALLYQLASMDGEPNSLEDAYSRIARNAADPALREMAAASVPDLFGGIDQSALGAYLAEMAALYPDCVRGFARVQAIGGDVPPLWQQRLQLMREYGTLTLRWPENAADWRARLLALFEGWPEMRAFAGRSGSMDWAKPFYPEPESDEENKRRMIPWIVGGFLAVAAAGAWVGVKVKGRQGQGL